MSFTTSSPQITTDAERKQLQTTSLSLLATTNFKRNRDHFFPSVSDVQKRYMEYLLTQIKFYFPNNLQKKNIFKCYQLHKNKKNPPIFVHEVNTHQEIISDLNELTTKKDLNTKLSLYYLKSYPMKKYYILPKYYPIDPTDNKIPFHT